MPKGRCNGSSVSLIIDEEQGGKQGAPGAFFEEDGLRDQRERRDNKCLTLRRPVANGALPPTPQSPPTSPPIGRKEAPVSNHVQLLPAPDDGAGSGHGRHGNDFGDTQDEEEEITGMEAVPKEQTQSPGSAVAPVEGTDETPQGSSIKAFMSPTPAHPTATPTWNILTTTAAPTPPHPATSTGGTDQTQTPPTVTVAPPMTVAAGSTDHQQDTPTPTPSANPSLDHTHSPYFTGAAVVREEVVTSGRSPWEPNRKGEGYQLFTGSTSWPLLTVGRTESPTVTPTPSEDRQGHVQPQSQTRHDVGSTTVTKAPTTPTPIQVLHPISSTRSPAFAVPPKRSPDPQSTALPVKVNGTLKQPTVSEHRAGKGEPSARSTSDPKLTGGQTVTVTPATSLNTTVQQAKTERITRPGPTPILKVAHGFGEGSVGKNTSVSVRHPPESFVPVATPAPSPRDPCESGLGPCVGPSAPNGTALVWGDLRRTLSFAWELHVYGTAGLFLLLAGGALLGLLLSPGLHCPHRGCLALANALLLLAGALRAAHFFIDPYGSRGILPHSGVAALYNLPLAMLLWAQAVLGLLALKGAGMVLLPPGLQRLPLAAVLAVLHCTLMLAADLLSPALSPAVLVVVQTLSLSWGLGLCLGYLFYAFPRLRRPPPPPNSEDHVPREDWQGAQRAGRVLGRVLAVCACLGAVCCGLHVHATLWLYGLLGDWRRFSWGWWLVQFWARLLELAWAFSLLLLASWVFWRPRGRRGDMGLTEGRMGADLPSSSSSSTSMQRHTCWAKIVQSLRGRPCRKSESNGIGGGGAGELPNNWAGQERPGADISKSLIRNRDPPAAASRGAKESNRGRNQKGSGGTGSGSMGSLLRLQSLGRPPQRSLSSSLERAKEWALEKESVLSLNDFDLRPPSPIDLSRSIDEALHREHLLRGGSLFRPLARPSSPPSPGPRGPPLSSWPRRSSDPQINLSDSASSLSQRHSDRTDESAAPPGAAQLANR
ncbi:hypothetical protein AGOR_G00139730 [Albula goreensis]|uniref:Proline-rich transmembrane protein 3/4 domain-containing protein n=1 Tax=Albula goreensis TaxID=1534307 RepID=A0A8T3DBC2_9TELE|nr:hypothetical protein AGOR_G00139730 [Albula goreensis]